MQRTLRCWLNKIFELVREHSMGKALYFINEPLVGLLMEAERSLA